MNYTELQCNGHSVKLILENYKYKSVLTAHTHDLCHFAAHAMLQVIFHPQPSAEELHVYIRP